MVALASASCDSSSGFDVGTALATAAAALLTEALMPPTEARFWPDDPFASPKLFSSDRESERVTEPAGVSAAWR